MTVNVRAGLVSTKELEDMQREEISNYLLQTVSKDY